MSSAFDKYLLPGKCGYVPKAEVKVAEAAKLIAGAGGVAVLAHPMELKMGEMTLESLVHEWHGQGSRGSKYITRARRTTACRSCCIWPSGRGCS